MSMQPVTITALCELLQQLRNGAPLPTELRPGTRFVNDLGLASLELIGLVFLCEQAFGVNLIDQPSLLARLQTVGETIDAIRDLQYAMAGGKSATG